MQRTEQNPRLSRRLFLGGSLALAGTGMALAAKPPAKPLPTNRTSALDSIGEKAIAERITPGLLVGVARRGRIELVRPYGQANLDYAIPVSADTVFRIGSVTKQFAAACILKLQERNLLALDDTLDKHLPTFTQSGRFTIRQLLQHTSGLSDYTNAPDFEKFMRLDAPTLTLVEHIGHLDPLFDFEPGTNWKYSNSGYALLGAVIEKLAGQSFAEFLRLNITAPLGLTGTAVEADGDVVHLRASGYAKDPAMASGFRTAKFTSMTVPGAAGSMRSTLKDLVLWHNALFGGQVIAPASVEQMRAPARLKDGSLTSSTRQDPKIPAFEYGMGLFQASIEGHHAIGHAGGINGFNCTHYSFPEEQTQIVVLANSESAAHELTPAITKAVFATG